MIVLRAIGLLLMAAAFVALVVDAVKSIASAAFVITPLGQAWAQLDPASFAAAQSLTERYTAPFVWDPAIATVLLLPGWIVFAALGFAIYYPARRRGASHVFISQD